MNTNYGIKIGEYYIEPILLRFTPTWTQSGNLYRYTNNNVNYSFNSPFTTNPTVILNTQNDQDYSYCAVIGIIRNKTKITTLSFMRETVLQQEIIVRGVVIGT
ncbi:MAG: hypothetical protein IKO48_07940 [Elusimicrobia bacterium]|nr:hypothetical protein [Elusimicrobiota bacterium]